MDIILNRRRRRNYIS